MKSIRQNYFILGLLLTVFLSISFLVYKQAFSSSYASDTDEHIIFIYLYLYNSEPFYIPHPLWHYGVSITSSVLFISIEHAAAIFSAILVTGWTYIIYKIVKNNLPLLKDYMQILITFIIIIIGPLCIPWYNKIIFLGQGSPNIWHNVTLWTVKPFAVIAVYFLVEAVRTKNSLYYLYVFGSVIISLFAKPSFAIMFLPAIFVYMLVENIQTKQFRVFYILTILFSSSILLYQFIHTFNSGDSKVIFDFLGVWSESSQNIALSIVLALAFPMLFLLLEPKIINDDYILLAWIQVFIGIILYACLAQTGKYYLHGNFGWSYTIAMSIVYIFSIVKFFKIYNEVLKLKRYVLLLLLATQVGIGLYYYIKVLEGQNPMYIAIFL